MATTSNQPQPGDTAPPYLAFATFQSAIDNLRTHGLPDPIDKTTWDSRSGSDQIQIFAALRFLGLLGDGSRPTPELRSLVDAKPNTSEEKTILRGLIKAYYTTLFEQLNLSTATPGQLDEAIGNYQLKGTTKDRAVRFFLKAANYTGIPLSSRLTKTMRSSGSESSGGGADEQNGETAPTQPTQSTRRRRKRSGSTNGSTGSSSQSLIPETLAGNAMKTVALPAVNGTLTISGTFNAFGLTGDERKLVYEIIDMMNAFESKTKASE